MTGSPAPRTKWSLAPVFGLVGGLIVGLVVLAFVWPVATSSAHDLPVAVTGSPAAIDRATEAIAKAGGALDLVVVEDRAAAVKAIERRDVYGALVLGRQPETIVASGASTVAAQILRGVSAELPDSAGAPATVTDAVPLSSDDPSGAGLTAAAFPLVLGGMLGGIVISLLVVGVVRRLVALAVYGLVAGVAVTLIMHTWFGIVQGSFWLDVLALGLAMLATSSVIVGLNALIGPPGIGVGAVLTMLVANPLSGAAQPHEFITGPWGEVGQYFVPGAGSSLVRQISYFPDASSVREWIVLIAWAAAGIALSTLGHVRHGAPMALPADELEHRGTHVA
ncbi:MAG: hypothetical protein JWP31_1096 [Aeromicrobium sp.]|nr:hypothetical protein [Aeromicrobium sp.]